MRKALLAVALVLALSPMVTKAGTAAPVTISVISSRADLPDVFHRRAIAEIQLGDFKAAVPDLEHVVSRDPKYDSHRAAGLLAPNHKGGLGCWNGFGSSAASRSCQKRPSKLTRG